MKVNFVAQFSKAGESTESRKLAIESDYHLKKLGVKNVVCRNNPPYAEDSLEIDDDAEKFILHLRDSCLTSGEISIPEKNIRFRTYAQC